MSAPVEPDRSRRAGGAPGTEERKPALSLSKGTSLISCHPERAAPALGSESRDPYTGRTSAGRSSTIGVRRPHAPPCGANLLRCGTPPSRRAAITRAPYPGSPLRADFARSGVEEARNQDSPAGCPGSRAVRDPGLRSRVTGIVCSPMEATTFSHSSAAPTRVSRTTRPFGSAQGRLRGTRRWLITARNKSRLHSQTRATRPDLGAL